MRMKSIVLAAASAAVALGAASASAQVAASRTPMVTQGDQKLSVLHRYPVRDGVFMFTGPGGNTLVQVGKDGVLVVDPQGGAATAELLAEIRRLSPDKPIRWVVNTSANPERVAGNQAAAAAGVSMEGGNTRPAGAVYSSGGAPIWAHEGVLTRLSAAGGEPVGWPTDSYFVGTKDMFLNGEAVQLMHAPGAVTNGDSFVVLRRTDVIAAGDVYTPDRYPAIDLANGGSIQGLLDGLNQLIRLAVPEFNQQGGTLIVPGHGRISDEADLAEYRDMATVVRDRVRDMIGRRMTLAQIQAARPTLDYDASYGGQAAGARFVETVHRSLTQAQANRRQRP